MAQAGKLIVAAGKIEVKPEVQAISGYLPKFFFSGLCYRHNPLTRIDHALSPAATGAIIWPLLQKVPGMARPQLSAVH